MSEQLTNQTQDPGEGKGRSAFREYAEAFIIAILLALVIRTFVVQAFKIPSGSMIPTLQIGDHILVNKFIYRFKGPERGDVIVFKYPEDESRDFIKRVIGLPGEVIEVRDNGALIDGRPLEESYARTQRGPGAGQARGWALPLAEAAPVPGGSAVPPCGKMRGLAPSGSSGPCRVPEGALFMMGDNRDQSSDSRVWGPLDMRKIRGKAFLIYWSWDRDHFGVRWGRIGHLVR